MGPRPSRTHRCAAARDHRLGIPRLLQLGRRWRPPPDDFEQAAGESIDRTVDEALAETDTPRDRITQDIRYGHSAQVLLDATRDADLLVVGSRGHGSFYGALLGSVSQRCAVHAPCPVVIVRQ